MQKEKFASTSRDRMRVEGGGYRRDHLRVLAQRVEVDTGEVRIMGSNRRGFRNSVWGSAQLCSELAERQGFEPWIRFWRILTFQASAFDHSATAPHALDRGAP